MNIGDPRKYGYNRSEFPTNKRFGGHTLYLFVGMLFTKRQNALEQARFEREHGRVARIYKPTGRKIWAVYINPH